MALLGFSGLPLFLVLCFGHCLCDFPLQSDKIALGKCPGNQVEGIAWPYWLAGHVGTHALAVALISGNAWLGLAECDPLVDEGLLYADKLRAAGVAVDLEIYRGVTHEFIKMGRAIPEALRAHADAARALREAFAAGASGS